MKPERPTPARREPSVAASRTEGSARQASTVALELPKPRAKLLGVALAGVLEVPESQGDVQRSQGPGSPGMFSELAKRKGSSTP